MSKKKEPSKRKGPFEAGLVDEQISVWERAPTRGLDDGEFDAPLSLTVSKSAATINTAATGEHPDALVQWQPSSNSLLKSEGDFSISDIQHPVESTLDIRVKERSPEKMESNKRGQLPLRRLNQRSSLGDKDLLQAAVSSKHRRLLARNVTGTDKNELYGLPPLGAPRRHGPVHQNGLSKSQRVALPCARVGMRYSRRSSGMRSSVSLPALKPHIRNHQMTQLKSPLVRNPNQKVLHGTQPSNHSISSLLNNKDRKTRNLRKSKAQHAPIGYTGSKLKPITLSPEFQDKGQNLNQSRNTQNFVGCIDAKLYHNHHTIDQKRHGRQKGRGGAPFLNSQKAQLEKRFTSIYSSRNQQNLIRQLKRRGKQK